MKKFICLITIIVLAFTLVSCSSFEKDPKVCADNLEKKGFYVELYDHSSVSGMLGIWEITDDFEIKDYSSWIDYIVFCENEEEGFFFYCYDSDSAKNIENGLEELTRKYRGYAESVIQRQGNIVYFGAEENWKEIK